MVLRLNAGFSGQLRKTDSVGLNRRRRFAHLPPSAIDSDHDFGPHIQGNSLRYGRLKTEFSTKEGAEHGAIELKRRFPMLRIRIYDAASQSRHDLPALG